MLNPDSAVALSNEHGFVLDDRLDQRCLASLRQADHEHFQVRVLHAAVGCNVVKICNSMMPIIGVNVRAGEAAGLGGAMATETNKGNGGAGEGPGARPYTTSQRPSHRDTLPWAVRS